MCVASTSYCVVCGLRPVKKQISVALLVAIVRAYRNEEKILLVKKMLKIWGKLFEKYLKKKLNINLSIKA